ncbi:sorbosone dehydrogenase family protein [uncultured Parasphingorhabdus sp.]|uniref:PQQ-dependent sugar dehydrogenase n=1 Tax=uncultured Parasphingorhabdus sp. TaxID=2709694 RepID=UPI0030DC3064|tara:strand:+ start:157596 stop:158951 length:1356 start_codon:yes stop_codon:yes gene_type:complete
MLKHIRNVAILLIILGVGAGYYFMRGDTARLPLDATTGVEPTLTDVRSENFPTINIAKAEPWGEGEGPIAAEGFVVERFAEGLDHPRSMFRLPNGDLLVAETNSPPRTNKGIEGWVMRNLMSKAGAGTESANRIVLLRDTDKDGQVDEKFTFLENLNSPFGIELIDDTLYIANTDAVYAYPYAEGDTEITAEGRKVANLNAKEPNNHWTRGLLASQDGKYLYISVGSNSNIGENGMETEKERASILQVELATNKKSIYAAGMRNPVGMAYLPGTDKFYTVVNERDMLGSDMVPDYLTEVRWGAHYGWPWHFWGGYVDPRVEKNLDHRQYERRPDYGLGAHVAPLGLAFSHGQALGKPFATGAVIARHGSWNRQPLSGYDVVYVNFNQRGEPEGKPVTILSGFTDEEQLARGRPAMVAFDQTGALLVSDDVGGIIWRVSRKGAAKAAVAADE